MFKHRIGQKQYLYTFNETKVILTHFNRRLIYDEQFSGFKKDNGWYAAAG
jgi:hypothetical protein